jgi:hypothetical protein
MVATAAQIAANRANARRSTGPRTAEGKAASSRNALTHGVHASDDTILATAADTYLADFRAHFQPVGVLEAHLVDHLAVLASRRERLHLAMDALLELNERHALTEHLHERYGINIPNGAALGQPSWQPAMRRYDGHDGPDPRRPELVSDPALDPDPILCSLAYTLSGPRAAALFRHEASVDRRFTATLKELTAMQAQRLATATASTPPAGPLFEPSLQRALDRHIRATASASDISLPSPITAQVQILSTQNRPVHDPAPAAPSTPEAPLPDRTQSATAPGGSPAQRAQNEPDAALTTANASVVPSGAFAGLNTVGATRSVATDQSRTLVQVRPPDQRNEAVMSWRPAEDEPTTFLSVLPRRPDEPSSIPAHWPDATPLAGS